MSAYSRISMQLARLTTRLPKSRLSPRFNIACNSYATKNIAKAEDEEDNSPIKYMKSPAAKWRAKSSRTGTEEPRLWYEPYVLLGSLTIFMVYFCILREENHIDKELERTLYSRIAGLEELQLVASLKHNQSIGASTEAIEARLREIRQA